MRIFDKNNNMYRCFGVDAFRPKPSLLSIVEKKSKPESRKVIVLGRSSTTGFAVKVIEISDSFLCGEEFVWYGCRDFRISSITICDNGNVMAVTAIDPTNSLPEVHVFSAIRDFLHKFKVVHETNRTDRVKNSLGKRTPYIVVSIPNYYLSTRLSSWWDIDVSVYKEDGKLVNHFSIMKFHRIDEIKSITINSQGRIALAYFFGIVVI